MAPNVFAATSATEGKRAGRNAQLGEFDQDRDR